MINMYQGDYSDWNCFKSLLERYCHKDPESTKHRSIDSQLSQRLGFLILQTFGKTCTQHVSLEPRRLPSSPFYSAKPGYERFTSSPRVQFIELIASRLEVPTKTLYAVKDHQVVQELIIRQKAVKGTVMTTPVEIYHDSEKFMDAIRRLFREGRILFPKAIYFNFSSLLKKNENGEWNLSTLQEVVSRLDEQIASLYPRSENPFDLPNLSRIAIRCWGCFDCGGAPMIYAPEILETLWKAVALPNNRVTTHDFFKTLLNTAGLDLGAESCTRTLVNWMGYSTVLNTLQIDPLTLSPNFLKSADHSEISSFATLLGHPLLRRYNELSGMAEGPPYLKVIPAFTDAQLQGLKTHSIDKVFEEKGIQPLIGELSRLVLKSLQESIDQKQDMLAFMRATEVIHQVVQHILEITRPYDPDTFEASVLSRLATGTNPVIPINDFESKGIEVHCYPVSSCMTAVATSLMACIQSEKKDSPITVLVQKNAYYECGKLLDRMEGVNKVLLPDGLGFSKSHIEALVAPDAPVRVFVGEFRHNISMDAESSPYEYDSEPVLQQILVLFDTGRVTKQVTVILDLTLSLEHSDEVRELLADDKIQGLLASGRLNLVLVRSGVKFDTLMDNYSVSPLILINNSTFSEFNQRFSNPALHTSPLNLQGYIHIKRSSDLSDKFRHMLLENNQLLYGQLPEEMFRSDLPVRVNRMIDKQTFFIDFALPLQFSLAFFNIVKAHVPILCRGTFGTYLTNITGYESRRRISVGLEDKSTIRKLGDALKKVYQIFKDMRDCPDEQIIARLKAESNL